MVQEVGIPGFVITAVADCHLCDILAGAENPDALWLRFVGVWADLTTRQVAGTPRSDILGDPVIWSKASGGFVFYFRRAKGICRLLGVGYAGEDGNSRVLAER